MLVAFHLILCSVLFCQLDMGGRGLSLGFYLHDNCGGGGKCRQRYLGTCTGFASHAKRRFVKIELGKQF